MLNAINWKLKYGIIGVIVAIVLVFIGGSDAFKFMKDPIQVKTGDDVKNLKDGDHVQFDITMIYDCIISQTTTTTKYGIKESEKESARYYVVPFLETQENNDILISRLLTIKINSQYFDSIEKAYDDFWKFWEDYSIPLPTTKVYSVDGIIVNMSDEEKKYAKELVDTGYMSYIYVKTPSKSASFIILAIGCVFFLVGVLFLVLYILGRKKDKERLEEMRANNPGYYQAPEGVTFNNNAVPQNYNGFDPSTDPRFNGMASGNPTGVQANNQPNNQTPTQGYYNEVPGSDFNNNSNNNINNQ